jgi:hypothetical protein
MDNGEVNCATTSDEQLFLEAVASLGALFDVSQVNTVDAAELSSFGVPAGVSGTVQLVYRNDDGTVAEVCDGSTPSDVCDQLRILNNIAQPSMAEDNEVTLGELLCLPQQFN